LKDEIIQTIYEVYDENLLKYKLNKASMIKDESWEHEIHPEEMIVDGKKLRLIDFKREVQNLKYGDETKKIMIITAFERQVIDEVDEKYAQGKPIILIYHLKSDRDNKPEMVYCKFLNNITYENSNFIHPNVFIQNGKYIYFIHFQNCKNNGGTI
jgi:hypothetical protein